VPGVATGYTANKASTRYTFTLRRNVRFTDGSPLTSDDVVFSLMRFKNLNLQGSFLMAGVTATARGPYTVVLTANKPYPSLPRAVASVLAGIVNADVVRRQGGVSDASAATADKAQTFLNANSAGSGPYVLESIDPQAQVVLVANPRYWGPKPYYTRVVLKNVSSAVVQKLDLQSGQAQLALDIGGDNLHGLPNTLQVRAGTANQGWYLEMNMSREKSSVTSNAAFREAVRYAIDYKGYLKLVGTRSVPMAGIIPPAYPGALPPKESVKQDLQRARAAMARSGLNNPTVKIIYVDFNFVGINFGTVVQKIRADLAQIGVNVQAVPMTFATFVAQQFVGNYEMSMRPQNGFYVDPENFTSFAPGGVFAMRNFYSEDMAPPALKRALAAARTETDQKKRLTLFQAYQRRLNAANGPYVFLFASPAAIVTASKSVTNLRPLANEWKVDLAELKGS
jgi:peptide/nickel transport system substrate-binding protein